MAKHSQVLSRFWSAHSERAICFELMMLISEGGLRKSANIPAVMRGGIFVCFSVVTEQPPLMGE